MDAIVCLGCGVEAGNSKERGWIHLGVVPVSAGGHEVEPGTVRAWEEIRRAAGFGTPLQAAREWAEERRERMSRPEMQGVQWDQATRHAVVLLSALELLEKQE